MTNREVDAIRAMLLASPRPTTLAERRKRLDGLGAHYAVQPDVQVEPPTPTAFLPNGPSRPPPTQAA